MSRNSSSIRRYAGLIFCYSCGALYVVFQGGKVAGMIFGMMNVLLIYLLMGRWSGIRRPQIVQRKLLNSSSEIEAGTVITVALKLKIPGRLPLPYVIVNDQLRHEYGRIREFESSFVPDRHRQGEVVYETPPLRRGVYTFTRTECVTEDIFGFLKHRGLAHDPQTLQVYPRTVSIRHWKDFNQLARGDRHRSRAIRARQESTQIDGVRDYVYGDRISRIHWNASARTGEWKSKEFERESLPAILIMLDGQRDVYENQTTFETAVSVAASFVKFAQKNDLTSGLLTSGGDRTYMAPTDERQMKKKMMHHLVTVACDGREPIDAIIARMMPEIMHAFLVVISPIDANVSAAIFKQLHLENKRGLHIKVQHRAQLPGIHPHMHVIERLEELAIALGGHGR